MQTILSLFPWGEVVMYYSEYKNCMFGCGVLSFLFLTILILYFVDLDYIKSHLMIVLVLPLLSTWLILLIVSIFPFVIEIFFFVKYFMTQSRPAHDIKMLSFASRTEE